MRSDAARRRAEIIRAARHLFAAEGGDVPLDAVAAAAGVGIATLYRNFPSRDVLADEVALAILGDMRSVGRDALDAWAHDPARAWDAYVRRLVDLDLGALSAALTEHLDRDLSPTVRAAQDETLAGAGEVLQLARGAGLVRRDLEPLELVLGVGLVTRPLPEAVVRAAPDLVARMTDILLRGLRP